MKKTIFLLISCAYAFSAHAQMTATARLDLGRPEFPALSIPQEFSLDNSPKLTMYDNGQYSETIKVYDEELNLVKTIGLGHEMNYEYQLTYQDKERELTGVVEVEKTQHVYPSYQSFLTHYMTLDPSFTEVQLTITVQANGDSLITTKYAKNRYGDEMYFAYDYFEKKYPQIYWICSKGTTTQYRIRYAATYTDWHITGTHTSTKKVELERIKLCNINLNLGDGKTNNYFVVSQTLFNNDSEYEYILPKYKLSTKGNILDDLDNRTLKYEDYERISTTTSTLMTEASELALVGFTVMSSDGTVVKDLDFDNDFEGSIDTRQAYIITIGKNTYLAFDGSMDNKQATIFYKIDRTTSDIRQVKKAPISMHLSAAIAKRNATIDIHLDDDNKEGSDIIVVSTNGTQIKRMAMHASEKSTQFSINAAVGMYCVSRIQRGKVVETRKIVIK